MAGPAVRYTLRRFPAAQVAILELCNPPVNALSKEIREALLQGVQRADADPDVRGVIVKGAGAGFSGGADISEFASGRALEAPVLPDVCDALEDCSKPVVAAIHGNAMGGGLEVAMGCHARVAAEGATLSLPEVKLGILPGAGGTQRLPRLVGVKHAISVMTSGRPLGPAEAHDMGLVDEVVPAGGELEERLLEAAASRIEGALDGSLALRRSSELTCPESENTVTNTVAEAKRILNPTGNMGGKESALAICDAVAAAATQPYAEGLRVEQRLIRELAVSPTSLALRHLFFAERGVLKIPELAPGTPGGAAAADGATLTRNVGVIGAGTMGGGIVISFLNVGANVTLVEAKDEALQRGVASIAKIYDRDVARGRMTAEKKAEVLGRLNTSLSIADLSDCDAVVEAVFENMEVKQSIFASLDKACKPGALLCTNTSTLDIDAIANATSRPGDVIGMHFFSPANIMKLVEIVKGANTSSETTARVAAMTKRLRKVGVVVGNCDGFVGNRMLASYTDEAGIMLEEGLDPPAIDGPVRDFGMPMGPFQMGDLAGNDITWRVRKGKGTYNPEKNFADALCDMGRYGQKTQAGWYKYDPKVGRGRMPLPDDDLYAQLADFRSRQPKVNRTSAAATADEVAERCFFPLVNEGFRLLEEGIARTPADIDVIYVYGYGWPAWRGGPMHWAVHQEGLRSLVQKMDAYRSKYEPNADVAERYSYDYRWTPCSLLRAAAAALPEATDDADLNAFMRAYRKGSKL